MPPQDHYDQREALYEARCARPAAPLGSAIELLYNGDYPGYPCARLNGHWLNDFEEQFLCKLFGVGDLRALFDKLGAKKLPGSAEHMAWSGVLNVTASQNTQGQPARG